MKSIGMSEATVVAEYEALRDEILLRLEFQQHLINYSLIATGLIVPIMGLFGISSVDPHGVMALLLIGPIVSVFLQLIYLKQYAYIQQLSSYITSSLGLGQALDTSLSREGIPPFSGWEKHLNTKLIKPRVVDAAIAVTGFAEGTFPTIGGILYLLAFFAAVIAQATSLDLVALLIGIIWVTIDIILLLAVILISVFARSWGTDLRMKAEKPPEN
jgi:hypothetical protein